MLLVRGVPVVPGVCPCPPPTTSPDHLCHLWQGCSSWALVNLPPHLDYSWFMLQLQDKHHTRQTSRIETCDLTTPALSLYECQTCRKAVAPSPASNDSAQTDLPCRTRTPTGPHAQHRHPPWLHAGQLPGTRPRPIRQTQKDSQRQNLCPLLLQQHAQRSETGWPRHLDLPRPLLLLAAGAPCPPCTLHCLGLQAQRQHRQQLREQPVLRQLRQRRVAFWRLLLQVLRGLPQPVCAFLQSTKAHSAGASRPEKSAHIWWSAQHKRPLSESKTKAHGC
jgi:hypothetical protein